MLSNKKIIEQMEDGGIVELSEEYGLEVTAFMSDIYLDPSRKAIAIKQRIQREGKNTTDIRLMLNETETKNLYLTLQEIFKDD